ncbi:MAG: hypothetical protein L6R38_007630 [Xanthoria sp. 2 TBL-2021]|nr:MAG: hypothetical protein L6R38_007630 [Xanthoria sp. 2 TBL-2021]
MTVNDPPHLNLQYSGGKGIENDKPFMDVQPGQRIDDNSSSDVLMSNPSSISPDYTLGANSSYWDHKFPSTTAPNAQPVRQEQPHIPYDLATLHSFPGEGGHESATPPSSSTSGVSVALKGLTVLTIENLDAGTRAQILDLLFKRKLVMTVEII